MADDRKPTTHVIEPGVDWRAGDQEERLADHIRQCKDRAKRQADKKRRLASRNRQYKHRAKYKSAEDLVFPQWAEKPLRRLLGVPFGGDIPDDIKEKFLKWLVPVRKDLRRRSGCMINCGRSSRTYIASIHFCWNPA
jgi:hypothetical protein